MGMDIPSERYSRYIYNLDDYLLDVDEGTIRDIEEETEETRKEIKDFDKEIDKIYNTLLIRWQTEREKASNTVSKKDNRFEMLDLDD